MTNEIALHKDLYSRMIKIRLTEETIAKRYSEWEMRCPTHLSIGQEAVASGVSVCLTNEDFMLSTHRCHAHYLAKGGDLNKMMAELYGKSSGCAGGKAGSMHLVEIEKGILGASAVVGTTIPVSAGYALALKNDDKAKEEKRVLVSFFGDGATEEGVFAETVNFAALKKLPMIFICENNFWSNLLYSPDLLIRLTEIFDL